jgi:hypothetical protein
MATQEPTQSSVDPFDVGQITERLPAWELFEDGVEPVEDDPPTAERHDRAA